MWNQFEELSEDAVFDHAFLVKTVFRVSKDVVRFFSPENQIFALRLTEIKINGNFNSYDV